MGVPPGPQVASNVKISPSTLEQYFSSIQEPFRETRKGYAEEAAGGVGILAVAFIFSLIPLIPYLLSKLALRLFGPGLFLFLGIHIRLSSFFFWWLTCFVISLSSLVLVGKFSGPSAEERKKWLSPQQMRFAYCYGVVDEIRKYKTNQLSRHIETARKYVETTRESLRAADLGLDGIWRREIHFAEGQPTFISLHGQGPKWYRLEPDTELILRAFRSLMPKLGDRLNDRKDLGAIQSALADLATYLYTEIPELSDSSRENNQFEQAGMESLLRFARQIVELVPYQSEQVKQTPKERFSRKFISAGNRLSTPFVHENVLIAFCAWYVVTMLLFCGGFEVAFRLVPSMKVDSTIVTAIVGGPIATAVTAVTIPRLARNKKDKG